MAAHVMWMLFYTHRQSPEVEMEQRRPTQKTTTEMEITTEILIHFSEETVIKSVFFWRWDKSTPKLAGALQI